MISLPFFYGNKVGERKVSWQPICTYLVQQKFKGVLGAFNSSMVNARCKIV